MQKLFITIFIIIVSLILLINNNRSPIKQSSSDKMQVVASFYPLYFFSNQIGGKEADVTNITPSGVQPHDYDLTTQDLIKINRSKLLVLNGGGLAGWEKKLKDELSDKTVVVAEGESDPHVWLDPILAKETVAKIEKGFQEADPQNKAYYQSNARSLEDKLDSLDYEFKKGLSACQKKDFVTSHEAFGYLARRYGINQVAISGLSPEEEPTSQKLAEIADKVKKEKINVIFFESLVGPKLSQTIANETGARTLVLDPIEGSVGPDYFSLMRNNLNNLKKALQCE